jgi:hypothetical protein
MDKAAIYGVTIGAIVLLGGLILEGFILYIRPESVIPWSINFVPTFCAFAFSTLGFRAGAKSADRSKSGPTEE